jgi:hypothetical protein
VSDDPLDLTEEPITYARSEPRLFGTLPVGWTLAIGASLLALGIAAVALGVWGIGAALIPFGALMFAAGIAPSLRDPTNPVSRVPATAINRTRGWAGFAGGSAGAWTRTWRDLLRLRLELRQLLAHRRALQLDLGEAAYRQDDKRMAELRARMTEVDDAVARGERRATAARRRARRHVERRREANQPTQQLR